MQKVDAAKWLPFHFTNNYFQLTWIFKNGHTLLDIPINKVSQTPKRKMVQFSFTVSCGWWQKNLADLLVVMNSMVSQNPLTDFDKVF